MINIRCATATNREEFLEFASKVFSEPGDPKDFPVLLPKIFLPENMDRASNYLAYENGDRLVGMATLCSLKMYAGNNLLKIGYIGTVSVAREYQGRGIMKLIMEHLIEESKKVEYDYLYLDGTRQRYGYYGFAPAGERIKVTITKSNVFHSLKDIKTEGIEFVKLTGEDDFSGEALKLHNKRKVRFDRSTPGFATIALTFGGEGYLALKDKMSIGYLIKDKDTGDITDFFCPDTADVYGVIKTWIEKSELERTVFHVPPYEREILKKLTDISEVTSGEVAGKVRIINYISVVKTLLEIKSRYTKLTDNTLSFIVGDSELTIKVIDNNIDVIKGIETEPITLNTIEAGRFFLDPFGYSLREGFTVNWFPLPLYIPRADSI